MLGTEVAWCLRIQNMFGRVVKRERPEKKPTSSITVNTRDRLSATSNLGGVG